MCYGFFLSVFTISIVFTPACIEANRGVVEYEDTMVINDSTDMSSDDVDSVVSGDEVGMPTDIGDTTDEETSMSDDVGDVQHQDSAERECIDDTDCNDGNVCTVNSCTDQGECMFAEVECAEGQFCLSAARDHVAVSGCVSCLTGADCNDGNPYTADSCTALGTCINDALRVHVMVSSVHGGIAHLFYASTVAYVHLPVDGKMLLMSEVCVWGVDIAVEALPEDSNVWWDCNPGTPSKSELVVSVNMVHISSVFVTRPDACGGNPPGNLWISPYQLGCSQ